MKLTKKAKQAEKELAAERCRNGTGFLEHYIFCGDKAVVVKGKFNIACREENRLIFTVIRPFNEKNKTMKKVANELSFPVDALWKVRLMEKAVHKEIFYIIGRIKVVYANGLPQGTLALAEDIVPCPVMTESRFMDQYFRFRDRCYLWPMPGEMSVEAPLGIIRRRNDIGRTLAHTLDVKPGNRIQAKIQNRRVQRVGSQWTKHTNAQRKENVAALQNYITETGRQSEAEKADTMNPAAMSGSETRKDYLLQYDQKYAKGRMLDESVTIVSETHFDMSRQWETEFGTTERTVKFYGCRCDLENNIVFVSNDMECWQIRYSAVSNRIVLYHKNKKKIKHYWEKSEVEGYHEQFVPSIKEMPTIKEYVIYAALHKLLAEKGNEKPRRKKK